MYLVNSKAGIGHKIRKINATNSLINLFPGNDHKLNATRMILYHRILYFCGTVEQLFIYNIKW